MAFHLMFYRDASSAEAAVDPQALWDGAREGALTRDAAPAATIAATLVAADPTLDRQVSDDDGTLSVMNARGVGSDWAIGPKLVIATAQVTGVKPPVAEAAFAALLDCAAALRDRHGLAVWSPELGRRVDPDADHEILARQWLRHLTEAAASHLEATRRGGHLNLIGALVLLAALIAISQSPGLGFPVMLLILGVLLAVAVMYLYRRRQGSRDGG